ncbi:hypothetical protein [Candidatus Protochlamydia sp. R18]|uniref:hypothetical protein n=1 Tax=Candidatus Protochlamydia sp. R18 TaxID=1353977 RepID=UPI0005AA1924|nr:hypothetical protein [Candidatus Protochlamydia sp. R18]
MRLFLCTALYSILIFHFPMISQIHQGFDEQIVIHSGEAKYNGKDIHLIGQVTIQHGLGKISAQLLSISPSQSDLKKHFSFFHIRDNVLIEFQGGGEIVCQEAEIDYSQLKGHFKGNTIYPDVVYKNHGVKDHERDSLIIKSLEMEVALARIPISENQVLKTVVKSLEAKHHVRAHYLDDYILLADRAFFECLQTNRSEGILTLFAKEQQPYCLLTNRSGDHIQAEKIKMVTIQKKLFLNKPKGSLHHQGKNSLKQKIDFSADELVWDQSSQRLILKGNVKVYQDQVFQLDTKQELIIEQQILNGQKTLRSMISPRQTTLIYDYDSQKELSYKIISPGKLVIDHENFVTTIEGLKDKEGNLVIGEQVYFENSFGDIYADQVYISYEWKNQRLIPSKIILTGNIKLMNRYDGLSQGTSSILQYAMADQVEYFPDSHEMTLFGKNGHRVLFFDKVNNVQISAPALRIRNNKKNHKNSFQGIGDVRFTFIEKELSQFKQRFSLDDHTKQEE